jgi:hypothetical protein
MDDTNFADIFSDKFSNQDIKGNCRDLKSCEADEILLSLG